MNENCLVSFDLVVNTVKFAINESFLPDKKVLIFLMLFGIQKSRVK